MVAKAPVRVWVFKASIMDAKAPVIVTKALVRVRVAKIQFWILRL